MLPKPHRLRKSQEYDLVYQQGQKHYTPIFMVFIRSAKKSDLPNHAKLPRFGVVASKKVGNAVARNRAKRMVRESIRKILPDLKPEFEAVIISFDKILESNTEEITELLKNTFEKAEVSKTTK